MIKVDNSKIYVDIITKVIVWNSMIKVEHAKIKVGNTNIKVQ